MRIIIQVSLRFSRETLISVHQKTFDNLPIRIDPDSIEISLPGLLVDWPYTRTAKDSIVARGGAPVFLGNDFVMVRYDYFTDEYSLGSIEECLKKNEWKIVWNILKDDESLSQPHRERIIEARSKSCVQVRAGV